MEEITLAERLVAARERRGLTRTQAAAQMGNVSRELLYWLEGAHPKRQPGESHDLRLVTVLDLVETYWPDLTLQHFCNSHVRFVPKDFPARRRLKRNAPAEEAEQRESA